MANQNDTLLNISCSIVNPVRADDLIGLPRCLKGGTAAGGVRQNGYLSCPNH